MVIRWFIEKFKWKLMLPWLLFWKRDINRLRWYYFFSFDTKSKQWASKWDQSHLCSSFRLEMAAWWRARGPGKHSKIRWFWHFTCVQPWLYIGCSLWLAMFRFNQEKIAINELSDAIFRFQVAFTVVKICRFLMSQLAWKTLYQGSLNCQYKINNKTSKNQRLYTFLAVSC